MPGILNVVAGVGGGPAPVGGTAAAAPQPPRGGYWRADALVETSLREFGEAHARADLRRQRTAFYLLAWYHHRTLRVLNRALTARREPLVQAALRNLTVLHRALVEMHRAAPGAVPVATALDDTGRAAFERDVVARVLGEGVGALTVHAAAERVRRLDMLGDVGDRTTAWLLDALARSRHASLHDGRYRWSRHPYTDVDHDALGLRALAGEGLAGQFGAAGFRGLRDVERRPDAFRAAFAAGCGWSDPATGRLFVEAVAALLAPGSAEGTVWPHDDLIGSSRPRPYQREAYAAFRRGGYRGLVVDAPSGSGKTMVGMLCVQDWLRSLHQGRSALVVVPTSNYQQQWVAELCSAPFGLRLAPEAVFAGTPAGFARWRHRTGQHPPVLVLTYAGLAQLGSRGGGGDFDPAPVEAFLRESGVRFVLYDEVHKVAENRAGASGHVARFLMERLRAGELRGLIGFSGTALPYRTRLEALGFRLVHAVALEELVASGYVAPFAEFGVAFADSARERRVRERLDACKRHVRAYFDLLGPARLRAWFAELPADQRSALARDALRMYRGRPDRGEAIERRFAAWIGGGAEPLRLADWRLVAIVQLARGWSDAELVRRAGVDPAAFAALAADIAAQRRELHNLIPMPGLRASLARPGFAETLDVAVDLAVAGSGERLRGALATTVVGLYAALGEWYRQTGEGRVETIKAVVEAERGARPVPAAVVYDAGRHIRWRAGTARPGHAGAGGLFAQLLGDDRFTPMAVLSNDVYLPHREDDPLPARVADYVETVLLRAETASAIFDLAGQGLLVPEAAADGLRRRFDALLAAYLAAETGRPRPRGFDRAVLRPLRKRIRALRLGLDGKRLHARLNTRNGHLARLVQTLLDYAILARSFRQARVAELEQADGTRRRYCVVPMPGASHRRQLLYDLTARIVDDSPLPVDLVIVSNWARTGWNVIRPNLLIDATATRDAVAWQQLRGRAVRPARTWTADCARLIRHLTAAAPSGDGLSSRSTEPDSGESPRCALDDQLRSLLRDTAAGNLTTPDTIPVLAALGESERRQVAVALALGRNKVTHVYELLRATGHDRQVVYDRAHRRWRRTDAVAQKHARTASVDPFAGVRTHGQAGAPLVYAHDPRTDLPDDLRAKLADVLAGRDAVIVESWLADPHCAVLSPTSGTATAPSGASAAARASVE